jgi:hypothetical protein
MQLSEVFRQTQELMDRGEGIGRICHSIFYCLGGVSDYDKDRAISVIMNRICPYYDVKRWAKAHNLPNANSATYNDFREFRIRWLKALEEEFKQKGD